MSTRPDITPARLAHLKRAGALGGRKRAAMDVPYVRSRLVHHPGEPSGFVGPYEFILTWPDEESFSGRGWSWQQANVAAWDAARRAGR